MSDTVDVVAQAIRQRATARVPYAKPWAELLERVKQEYRAEAEAAIEAYKREVGL